MPFVELGLNPDHFANKRWNAEMHLLGSSHSIAPFWKGTLLSHRNSLCRMGSTSLGTGNEGFAILGITCFLYISSAYWVKTFVLFPILCVPPTHIASNPLAHTFHIFWTDGSFEMNYTQFHSQPVPGTVLSPQTKEPIDMLHMPVKVCSAFALIKYLMGNTVA